MRRLFTILSALSLLLFGAVVVFVILGNRPTSLATAERV